MNWDIISHVIIIIELTEREYNSKKKIEHALIKKGYQTIMLPREYAKIYLKKNKSLGKSIAIIDKSAQHYQNIWFEYIKECGSSLIVLEEEGWVPFSWKDFILRRLPKNNIKYIDEYWCSNINQYNVVTKQYPDLSIHFSGHPRWANSTKKCTSSKIQNILLVSTFGMLSKDIDFFKTMKAETGDLYDHDFYEEVYNQLNLKFEYWLQFIQILGENKDISLNIKLRLHPAEKSVYGRSFLNKINISSDSLIDDINSADMIIHPGSTVAFDAEFLLVPSILLDDNTNILLASDPCNNKLTINEIIKLLKSKPDGMDLYNETGIIKSFSYDFKSCVHKSKKKLTAPFVNIIFYNLIVKLLSYINYKNFKRIEIKLKKFNKTVFTQQTQQRETI